MKKIKISNKLNLNKESITTLNIEEQSNVEGGKYPKGFSRGCACTGSQVKTCGLYCPDDIIK